MKSLVNLEESGKPMSNELCIRLPYLHPSLNIDSPEPSGLYFAQLKYFWPGHAPLDSSSLWWQPENLPLSQDEAAKILSSLQNQNLQDLERVRLLMQQRLHEQDRRFRSEMADLEHFLEYPENSSAKSREKLPLKEAQILLLWLWRQEEEALEIDSLARKCALAESRLLDGIHEDASPNSSSAPIVLQSSRDLLSDWKKVFQNAALFMDPDISILLEGSLREDLLTEFPFEVINNANGDNNFLLKKASLPLWQILGYARQEHASPVVDRIWNAPRTLYALHAG